MDMESKFLVLFLFFLKPQRVSATKTEAVAVIQFDFNYLVCVLRLDLV